MGICRYCSKWHVLGRYGYDFQGRRILRIGDEERRQYTYDQLSVITEADQVNATVSKTTTGWTSLSAWTIGTKDGATQAGAVEKGRRKKAPTRKAVSEKKVT